MANEPVINRSYVDNFSVKDFASNVLVEKYFPDVDVSKRTVGMVGYTTELMANISEDVFNTGSVLFKECFVNRAQMDESIYSHAAVFQLSDIFSTASVCTFLLVLEESAIVENMLSSYDKDTGIYHFYIDKNTIIYVKDIPFTIDYDIVINIIKKRNEKGDEYIYTASYITDEYTNSISNITNPYISIRRSANGYIALEITCHQCIREPKYEPIESTNSINYPVIKIPLEGNKLAGFEVLYKSTTDSDYNIQLKPKVVYSRPSVNPFCYYQMLNSSTLVLTFNTKDGYFIPEPNSDLKIILYYTKGSEGKFPEYNGTDIQISTDDDKYGYTTNYIVSAKPTSGSVNGTDSASIEKLQRLATEGYSTANALTTEHDLAEYFSNYKYRFDDSEIMFIKKRDDVAERVYSAFIVMKKVNESSNVEDKDVFIYKTNTLNLNLNLSEMDNNEENIYILEPGLLFTANTNDSTATFLRDTKKSEEYYQMYLQAIENGEIDYITDNVDKTDIPSYLDRPASFAEFKKRKKVDDKLSIFDINFDDYRSLDNPREKKFLLINPFLIRFKKNPNMISMFMTYIDQKSLFDFTDQNEDSFIQFITYQLQVTRTFSADKKYNLTTSVLPSSSIDKTFPPVSYTSIEDENIDYILNDKYSVVDNDLRMVMVINDGVSDVCYTELYPTKYDPVASNFMFSGYIQTDDHITSTGKLRILDGTIYRDYSNGEYYEAHSDDATLYNKFDKNDNIIEENIPVDTVTELISQGVLKKFSHVVNMSLSDEILIPMSNVSCRVYTLYRRVYSEDGGLVLTTPEQTNNLFVGYDNSFKGYLWTNEYSTNSNPITFLKPLNGVRSQLEFKDFTTVYRDESTGTQKYVNDIMDVKMSSLPFIRWNMVEDSDKLTHFMTSFLGQYNILNDIINKTLRNSTGIDIKFYNTYGITKTFLIGEENELLDTGNLQLEFDTWFIPGTDLLVAKPAVQKFIKKEVETINTSGMNNLFISNLMRKVETNFSFVDHIRFKRINGYDTSYQAVKNIVTDLNELSNEDRRNYVPELLTIEQEDVIINDFYAS